MRESPVLGKGYWTKVQLSYERFSIPETKNKFFQNVSKRKWKKRFCVEEIERKLDDKIPSKRRARNNKSEALSGSEIGFEF